LGWFKRGRILKNNKRGEEDERVLFPFLDKNKKARGTCSRKPQILL
jgi:hypothetical protein